MKKYKFRARIIAGMGGGAGPILGPACTPLPPTVCRAACAPEFVSIIFLPHFLRGWRLRA